MLKLMKYEFRKTWITKAILLAVAAVLEAAYLFSLYGEKDELMGMTALLLAFLAVGGVLVMGLESVLTLHRDMNTKQSYMLFMTPNSSYRILGAKVLECGGSILITGAFFFALGALDITLLFARHGELNQLWEMIRDFLTHFSVMNGESVLTLDMKGAALLALSLLSGWIGVITSAYLADVVSAALLNGKKHNGIVSFVLFLALDWAVSYVTRLAASPFTDPNLVLLVFSLTSFVFAAIMYVVTAQIMERKLSV